MILVDQTNLLYLPSHKAYFILSLFPPFRKKPIFYQPQKTPTSPTTNHHVKHSGGPSTPPHRNKPVLVI